MNDDQAMVDAVVEELKSLRADRDDWKDAARSEANRVNELTTENARLRRRNDLMKNTRNEQLFEKLMKANEEIERLREALKRYEDEADSLRSHWPITHD